MGLRVKTIENFIDEKVLEKTFVGKPEELFGEFQHFKKKGCCRSESFSRLSFEQILRIVVKKRGGEVVCLDRRTHRFRFVFKSLEGQGLAGEIVLNKCLGK